MRYDDIVIGAGIIGLAHAYHLGRRGRRVLVIERSPAAQGASVRNFGMVWPMGQPAGPRLDTALTSRRHWLDVLESAGIWHDPCGSLHVAYHEDEEAVLREFAATANARGYAVAWADPDACVTHAPRLVRDGLRGGLYSTTELCVDPREVVAKLPAWLAATYDVTFRFGCSATAVDTGAVETPQGVLEATEIHVCCGDDLTGPFAAALQDAGLRRCKLQMLRTAPLARAERVGPMLAAGLTLRHYGSFADCATLPALDAGLNARCPGYDALGIHVMVSQNGAGELVLGDSHLYDDAITPFDDAAIDAKILRYLDTFFRWRDAPIAQRWHGIYAKHPTAPWVTVAAAPGVHVITGFGGAGMTLSFGAVAQRVDAMLAS
jgi:FAD dependent oxidoreductase TIGR03364